MRPSPSGRSPRLDAGSTQVNTTSAAPPSELTYSRVSGSQMPMSTPSDSRAIASRPLNEIRRKLLQQLPAHQHVTYIRARRPGGQQQIDPLADQNPRSRLCFFFCSLRASLTVWFCRPAMSRITSYRPSPVAGLRAPSASSWPRELPWPEPPSARTPRARGRRGRRGSCGRSRSRRP